MTMTQAGGGIAFESRRSVARLLSPLAGYAEVESRAEYRIDPLTGQVKYVLIRRNGSTLSVPWKQVETFSPESRKVELRDSAEMLPAGSCEGESAWGNYTVS